MLGRPPAAILHVKSSWIQTESRRGAACKQTDYTPPANKCEMFLLFFLARRLSGLQVSQQIVKQTSSSSVWSVWERTQELVSSGSRYRILCKAGMIHNSLWAAYLVSKNAAALHLLRKHFQPSYFCWMESHILVQMVSCCAAIQQ